MNAMHAQVVVSALIEKLQKMSTSAVIRDQDHTLEMQVHTAINKLNLLKRRLKLAEELEASPDHVQRMVRLLQAAYSAEDAADTLFTREVFQIETRINGNGSKKRFRWSFATSLCSRPERKTFEDEFREHLSSYDRMLEMTSDIEEVTGEDLQSQYIVQQRWGRISEFCMKEKTDVIVLEEHKNILEDLTVGFDYLSPGVILVAGEGGSGKTTLVRTVYNKLLWRRKSAWVDVPSMFRARYIMNDILKQIKEIPFAEDATVPEEELIARLAKMLKNERYLIVIEDVESPQVWEALCRGVIHSKSSRSTIVITTRNEDVARYDGKPDAACTIQKVQRLNNEESWKLFLSKVQNAQDVLNKSDELIKLEKQILDICGGLPLRIGLLGGLLSIKEPSYDEWSRVIDRANSFSGDVYTLSYRELPSEVKPCFLYMGLFPRGYEIHVRRLIHLWVSEGFVAAPLDLAAETVPEDLAEMYFEELVIRNLIQVKWRLDGAPKTCRMFDVLYDIFSPKAADVGFFHHQFHSSPDTQPKFEVRRLATRLGIKNDLGSSFHHLENLRSYVAFDTRVPGRPATEISRFLNKIITKQGFGLLKVLDLEGVYKPVLSDDAIGKLFLLSYLSLRSTAIDSLPSCVGNLPCLETLDVKHTIIHDLPTSVWKAKKLRHLYLNWSCSSTFSSSLLPSQPPTNLHTLWGLSIDDAGVGFLKTLTGLRRLGLTCISASTSEWVSQLTKLQSLKLRSIRKESNGKEILDLELPTLKMHHKLQDLYLVGKLSNVEFPPNLRMLTLSGSELQNDPMPLLGRLPHLHTLRLFRNAYRWDEMTCTKGEFPKLLVLKLWKLRFNICRVEEGGMPCLRELEFRDCSSNMFEDSAGISPYLDLVGERSDVHFYVN